MRNGDDVGELELVDETGQPWRLADQRGRPVLLVFHRHLM